MISIVIPSFNRRDSVLQLLHDVYAQDETDIEVLVIDDGSADDSVEAILKQFPAVRLLVNEVNGGPAVTRNRGIREAKGDIIVGFDSDVTVPDPSLLTKVKAGFKRNPAATGFAFRILGPDGVSDDVPRWWHPLPVAQFADKAFETSYFSGTAYAFRRDAVIKAGLFSEIVYMHYEEAVLAFRIIDHGGSIFHAPELTVRHHVMPTPRRNRIRIFYKPRAQVLFAYLCFPVARGTAYLVPRLAYGLLCALRDRYLSSFLSAIRSAGTLIRQSGERNPLRTETWKRIAGMRQQAS